MIWNNSIIRHDNKTIVFRNWIKSNMIYVNDITDKAGRISPVVILEKLENKSNWIAEFSIITKSIPKNWETILKSEILVKTSVNIKRNMFIWCKQDINLSKFTNKIIYESIEKQKYESSIGLQRWLRELELSDNSVFMSMLYDFIFNQLHENKLKSFRWRLLQYFVPTKKIMFQCENGEKQFL